MKLENSGKIIIIMLMVGVVILAISTLLTNPLALFLTIMLGSGLIVLGAIIQIIFMLLDIKTFFKVADSEK